MKTQMIGALTGVLAAFFAHGAAAEITAQQLVDAYQERGFDFIEVTVGIDQIKVEAIEGNQQIEVIYDRETGDILESETEAADADDIGRTGVQIRSRNRNFTGDDDDHGDRRGRGRGGDDDDEDDDDDDDRSGHGGGDDDDDDDHSGHGGSGDDDDDDDDDD